MLDKDIVFNRDHFWLYISLTYFDKYIEYLDTETIFEHHNLNQFLLLKHRNQQLLKDLVMQFPFLLQIHFEEFESVQLKEIMLSWGEKEIEQKEINDLIEKHLNNEITTIDTELQELKTKIEKRTKKTEFMDKLQTDLTLDKIQEEINKKISKKKLTYLQTRDYNKKANFNREEPDNLNYNDSPVDNRIEWEWDDDQRIKILKRK